MRTERPFDCLVIGYNEPPFEKYEGLIRQYGEHSEAYRDLKHSFVTLGERKLNYVDLLNHATDLARGREPNGEGSYRSGDIPTLAAVYLTSFLRRRGFRATYVNLFQHEKEKLIELLRDDPLCVAITTTLYVLNLPAIEIVEFIRQHNPKVKIIVGGPLVANHARNYRSHERDFVAAQGGDPAERHEGFITALDEIGADIYVIEGQGEWTLAQTVACLKQGGSLSQVPNIVYFEDGRYQMTGARAENNSLEENYINWNEFRDEGLGPTIQTRTARSCAFKCSFCNYPTRAGALTLASLETIEKELDSIRELGGVENVVFIDDTFNVPFPRFKEICRLMIRKNYGFNWFSYFRCSNSDEEAFELMAESNCKGVFLGVESGSPRILENMNKAATVEKYARGIELLRQHNILTFGSFIVGFPGETAQTIAETTAFIRETGLDYYRAQLWYCEPGTPIFHQRDKYGIEGEGFVWNHDTMESMEALDYIDRMFLTIRESLWLPQWSFDFWIIPYLTGKGISLERFREFMTLADRLLTMEIASVPPQEKEEAQGQHLQNLVKVLAA
jgi:p-methyltransferase